MDPRLPKEFHAWKETQKGAQKRATYFQGPREPAPPIPIMEWLAHHPFLFVLLMLAILVAFGFLAVAIRTR